MPRGIPTPACWMAGCVAALLWLIPISGASPAARADAAAIVIVSPKNGETIHDNAGNVAVAVTIRGDDGAPPTPTTLRVLLDGKPYGPVRNSPSFTLEGVERGEHTLQVQLVNTAGKMLASSDSVKFYMWRASRLFPGRSK